MVCYKRSDYIITEEKKMDVPESVVGWAVGGITGLVAVVWGQLSRRINVTDQSIILLTEKLSIIAENRIDEDWCKRNGELRTERIDFLKEEFLIFKNDNKTDHDRIGDLLNDLTDTTTDIKDCVNRLSAGLNCD